MSEHIEPVAGQQNDQGSKLDTLENNQPKGQWGGPRPGSGRPKGSMSLANKERLEIRKRFEDRIHFNADRLLNAALTKALGESFLFVKVTERDDNGKITKSYTEMVTDPDVIISYLNDELNSDRASSYGGADEEYYYITTKPVDMVAVKELYDRAFGKSLQRNELSGPEGEPLLLNDQQAKQLLALRANRE